MGQIEEEVAECCGLWLAEGGVKSKSEITFTNNRFELVDLFYKTIKKLFKNYKYNMRIYIYSRDGSKVELPYKDCVVKYYIHKRATKPYFIFRIASTLMVKDWNKIVNSYLEEKEAYPYILRGFFAGEGNIHTGKKSVRVIRISQSKPKVFINNMLNELELKFSFYEKNRNYILSGKKNWDIFAKLKIADLHLQKKEKFWKTYNEYKEEHYEKNYLSNKILEMVSFPSSTQQLCKRLKRSQARISETLVLLKKQKKVNNFRVKSIDYWTNNKNIIIISELKKNYLSFLDKNRKTSEFSEYFNVDWKSSFRRLKELNKLNLVKREENGEWAKLPIEKQIWVI